MARDSANWEFLKHLRSVGVTSVDDLGKVMLRPTEVPDEQVIEVAMDALGDVLAALYDYRRTHYPEWGPPGSREPLDDWLIDISAAIHHAMKRHPEVK
jgi:hypothetical protein